MQVAVKVHFHQHDLTNITPEIGTFGVSASSAQPLIA